jgi:hypothetical protein
MGRGLLQAHLEAFDKVGAGVADKRREGYDKQYDYADAIKGAYGIFFFQHPSMLEYQERLKKPERVLAICDVYQALTEERPIQGKPAHGKSVEYH